MNQKDREKLRLTIWEIKWHARQLEEMSKRQTASEKMESVMSKFKETNKKKEGVKNDKE